MRGMLAAAVTLRGTALVDRTRSFGPGDVTQLLAFLERAAPPDHDNYRVHAHLRLVGTFARKLAVRVGLDTFLHECAGLLHDCGRFLTHRYYRNDLLADLLFKKIGLRSDL